MGGYPRKGGGGPVWNVGLGVCALRGSALIRAWAFIQENTAHRVFSTNLNQGIEFRAQIMLLIDIYMLIDIYIDIYIDTYIDIYIFNLIYLYTLYEY